MTINVDGMTLVSDTHVDDPQPMRVVRFRLDADEQEYAVGVPVAGEDPGVVDAMLHSMVERRVVNGPGVIDTAKVNRHLGILQGAAAR